MNHDHVRAALHGVAVTNITVFEPGSFDLNVEAVAANARFLADAGIPLLIPCGNTGEFHSLTNSEWSAVVDAVIDAVGDRVTVMPAVGGPLPDAVAAAKYAEARGAPAVMVMPLHHTYTSTVGSAAYLRAVVEAVSIGVVGYVRNESLLESDVIELSADHPNLVGVKFAIPDVRRFANTMQQKGADRLEWSCGIAELWAPAFFVSGAVGFTSGLGSFAPRAAVALYEALARGDYEKASEIRSRMIAFEMLRARYAGAYNIPAVKEAMAICGMHSGVVRPPLSPVRDDDRDELRAAVMELIRLNDQAAQHD